MKKFKIIWVERVTDGEGDFLHLERNSQIIEAENMDAACDQWEKEHEHEDHNGMADCFELVEHDLFKKRLVVSMPDGFDYAVRVELIARDRAAVYADEFNDDIAESLREDTIPLFLEDEYAIHDWAANNMNWSEVKDKAIRLESRIDEDEFSDAWVNGEWSVK